MIVTQRDPKAPSAVIDLTATPYFDAPQIPAQPLMLIEASGLERVRPTDDETISANAYRTDRVPSASDLDLHFGGGLGPASVLDVGAHPLRARARSLDLMTVMAVALLVGVGLLMLTVVATLRY
ncbi:MAG TPA: hypothetical protein VHC43_10890 [Mycobacteriales bacterium]|nr:hypothetical protein [Mycobacteriales bacterium]